MTTGSVPSPAGGILPGAMRHPRPREHEKKGTPTVRTNATIRIVPAVKPAQKESAGVSQAKCRHEWEECECAGYAYWCQRCLIPGMAVDAAVAPGAAIYTVGPDGRPNGNTPRIGCGTVLSLHRETDGTGEEKDYAYVLFDDGKRGSWPVEQLRVQHVRRGSR